MPSDTPNADAPDPQDRPQPENGPNLQDGTPTPGRENTAAWDRPLSQVVPKGMEGQRLDSVLRSLLGAPWGRIREWIASGKIFVNGACATDPGRKVRPGQTLEYRPASPRPKQGAWLPPECVVHLDPQIVVLDKPAGLMTVPFEKTDRDTLQCLVTRMLRAKGMMSQEATLGVVHRLDRETSGLVVFARTWQAKNKLAAQFRTHTTRRRYLALVHGYIRAGTRESHLVDDRGDGIRGSVEAWAARTGTTARREGQHAITHVEILERLPGGATLVACRLETGRTHQIRIHLSEAGHPILGEPVYIRDYREPRLEASRLMLHAEFLGFKHPATGEDVSWESPMPPAMRQTLDALRRG